MQINSTNGVLVGCIFILSFHELQCSSNAAYHIKIHSSLIYNCLNIQSLSCPRPALLIQSENKSVDGKIVLISKNHETDENDEKNRVY